MRLPAIPLLPRLSVRLPSVPRVGGPHMRRRLAAIALVTVALGAVYMLWFRDSSLVQVKRVQVVGLSTAPDAARLRAQLTAAAERMTTLHLDAGELHKVVANDPVVRSISLRPDFPHGLTIDVTENRPVALVTVGAKSVPVAADGTVLEGVDTSGSLPEIRTVAMPGGRRVDRGAVLDRITVAAAAPRALLAKMASISIQPGKGYVAQIENGPAIWLGSLTDLELKWQAATGVLAQRSSDGATYVDVRMPQRAVAGGLQIEEAPQPDASGTDPSAPAVIPATPTTTTPQSATPQSATPQPVTPQTPAPPSATQPAIPQSATPPSQTAATAPPTTSTNPQP